MFEAHEDSDAIYYTQELIDGKNVAEMAAFGEKLEEEELLDVVKSAAQAFKYLYDSEMTFLPIWPEHVNVCDDGATRIANTVTVPTDDNHVPQATQIKNLAKCLHPLMDDSTKVNETIPNLLYSMTGAADDSETVDTWSGLLDEVKYIENQWVEMAGGITPRKAAILSLIHI